MHAREFGHPGQVIRSEDHARKIARDERGANVLVVCEGEVSAVGFLMTADAAAAVDLGGVEVALVVLESFFADDAALGEILHIGEGGPRWHRGAQSPGERCHF